MGRASLTSVLVVIGVLVAVNCVASVRGLHGQTPDSIQDSLRACLNPPAFKAIHRPDNDISFAEHPTGQQVALPPSVRYKIDALAQEACFAARAHGDELMPLGDYYGNTFLVRSPKGMSLYVFHRQTMALSYSEYFYMLYDSATGRVTARPQDTYGKWAGAWGDSDDVIPKPYVTYEDLDHDGNVELVVRERAHNGTSYNASIRHYYRIDPNLDLWPMLAVEEKSYQDVRPEGTWLLRSVRFVSQDSLMLITNLKSPGHPEREVGELLLTKNQTFGYHVVSTRLLDSTYRNVLITDSPSSDPNFLFTGSTLRY